MKIYSYRNLHEDVTNKGEYGCFKPEYWNQKADEVFRNFSIDRNIEIQKVVFGGSDYPIDELYFENGMNLHLGSYENENEKTLKEFGILK